MSSIGPKSVRLRLDPLAYEALRQRVTRRDGWLVNRAARWQTWKSITNSFAATRAMIPKKTSLRSVRHATTRPTTNVTLMGQEQQGA